MALYNMLLLTTTLLLSGAINPGVQCNSPYFAFQCYAKPCFSAFVHPRDYQAEG